MQSVVQRGHCHNACGHVHNEDNSDKVNRDNTCRHNLNNKERDTLSAFSSSHISDAPKCRVKAKCRRREGAKGDWGNLDCTQQRASYAHDGQR